MISSIVLIASAAVLGNELSVKNVRAESALKISHSPLKVRFDINKNGQLLSSHNQEHSNSPPPPNSISVIIPSRDEGMMLVHTLNYLFNTTATITSNDGLKFPPYIHEVLIVDDASDIPQERYISESISPEYLSKIVVTRLTKHEGLTRARLIGSRLATGQFLFFLDAHCRVYEGWAEHLISVAEDGSFTFQIKDDHSNEFHPHGFSKEEEMAKKLLDPDTGTPYPSKYTPSLPVSPSKPEGKKNMIVPPTRFVVPRVVSLEDPFFWDHPGKYGAIGGAMGIKNWGLDLMWLDSEVFDPKSVTLNNALYKHRVEKAKAVVESQMEINKNETGTASEKSTEAVQKQPLNRVSSAPIMPGGIFLVERSIFEAIGQYDPEMVGWGGENVELSLRIWLCGSEIVIAKDAVVGHVFKPSTDQILKERKEGLENNLWRTAYVWMDNDWFDLFLDHHGFKKSRKGVQESDEKGNRKGLEKRLILRRGIGCLNFKHYIEKFKATFEMISGIITINSMHLRNVASGLCLSAVKDSSETPAVPIMSPCIPQDASQWWLSVNGGRALMNIGMKRCLDFNGGEPSRIEHAYQQKMELERKKQSAHNKADDAGELVDEEQAHRNEDENEQLIKSYPFQRMILYKCDLKGLRGIDSHINVNQFWHIDQFISPGNGFTVPNSFKPFLTLENSPNNQTTAENAEMVTSVFDDLFGEDNDRHQGVKGSGLIRSMRGNDWSHNQQVIKGLDKYGPFEDVPHLNVKQNDKKSVLTNSCLGVQETVNNSEAIGKQFEVVVGDCSDLQIQKKWESIWIQKKV